MMALDFLDDYYGNREFTNFGAQLFHLIAKADPDNLEKLSRGFPKHVALYRWWMGTETPPDPDEVKSKADGIEGGA